jgi:hypothetical protein
MNNIIINKDADFKDETISSVPLGNNNFMINTNNSNLKKDEIVNNIKPMLSGNSNTITITDGKKVKIKPILNKKVPSNTFSMMANSKKNIKSDSEDDDDSGSDASSYESESNDILSNTSFKGNGNNQDDDDDDDEEDEDYSSIESNNKNMNNKSKTRTKDSVDDSDDDDETAGNSSNSASVKQKTYEEIQQEKQKLLFNLERLQKQGYPPSKRYSMASSYEDMQFEYDRLKKQRDVEKSIKFSRKILMAAVSGIEFLNNRFDPFDVKLDGWSENIMENVNDYDEVFEELHDKYSDSVKMAPELKLLAMVAGSGFMFHLTNSLFKSASPKLSDILKQNPDIAKNISEAAARNMGGTINQEFGDNDFLGNLMKGGINMKMNSPQSGPMGPSRGPMGEQPKMSGPQGIDDLLNELNSKDDNSVSSTGSITMRSSAKRTMKGGKKGGIALDLR